MIERSYGSLPFDEAIRFFRGKVDIPTWYWADLWQDQHDAGFMIAGAMKADLLADFRAAVDKAISDGTTLADFRKDFEAIVERHGWEYNGGRNWRSRVIYDTNLRQAYNAGREVQMADPELRRRRPYGLYRHGGSEQPRPLHLAWDGLVIPLDDPWWETHTPMNGWGCSCKKFMVGERDLRRLGKSGPDRAPNDGSYEWVDKVTGDVHEIPAGIDPGFGYRPGGRVVERLRRELGRKVQQLPPAIGRQLAGDLERLAPAEVWPAESEPVFSTVNGVNRRLVERALRAIPGAERQMDTLARFFEAHPQKALFIKQTEMSPGAKARALEPEVARFIGRRGLNQFTIRRASRVNGFTSDSYEHVVIKVPANANLERKLQPEEIPRQIAETIRARMDNDGPMVIYPRGTSGDPVRLHWSFSKQMADSGVAGEDARVLTTFIHELGHQVHFYAGAPTRPIGESVTRYGSTNDYEWHAEHFVAWLFNREALAGWNREVAEYFDELLEQAIASTNKTR